MNQDHHPQYFSPSSSELDSQSDSDWLDIVSSRESDDNDSVPSDREGVHSVPLSRRSSVSFGSSGEGDVEAWEGFVDDSEDDRSQPIRLGMYPNQPPVLGTQLDTLGSNLDTDDNAEDERVREGLEQSLISTLSASRSSSAAHSGSTHTSLRDLRLSFPDPLTSSKDNLPLSRSATPPPDDAAQELTAIPTSLDTATATGSQPKPEPGTGTTPLEVSQASKWDIDIDIVLYGSSPTSKWELIEQLLRKAASFTLRTLTSTTRSEDAVHFIFEPRLEAVQPNGIAVYDCTQGGAIHFTSSNPDRPSLAVVFLPSDSLHVLPEHTLYLPIFVGLDFADVVANDSARSVERAWKMLSVPPGKTLRLGNGSMSSILSSSELENVDPFRVHRALQRPPSSIRKPSFKTIADHLSSVPAVTFFALVSIVMSFAINTIFRPPETTPISIYMASPTWDITTTQVNSTVAAAQPTPVSQQGNALIASSLKEFALSIINPHSTSLSITSQSSSLMLVSQPLTPKAKTRKETQLPAYLAKISPSTDIILRPVPPTTAGAFTKPTITPPMTNKEERVVSSGSAVNIRLIDSVPELFETTVKTALDAVHSDLKELVDAMDELVHAIRDQTKKAVAKSADTALSIQDHVKYRNERARGKARELRETSEKFIQSAGEQLVETTWSMKMKGEQFVMLAQEHIKDRTMTAKEKAHGFRERMVKSDAWQTYVAGHEEWAKKVIDKKMAKREYKKWVKSLKGPKIKSGKERRKASKGRVCPVCPM